MATALKQRRRPQAVTAAHRDAPWTFLKALVRHDQADKSFRESVQKTALAENSGLSGGYLVPQDYSLALMEGVAAASIMWSRARVIPMLALETLCPRPDTTKGTSAGVSPFFGGVQFTWQGIEGGSIPETEPQYRQTSLKCWDLIGQLVVSNQFLNDIGEEGEMALTLELGKAAGYYLDYAFFNGKGNAQDQPLGWLTALSTNAPAGGTKVLSARGGAGHIAQADVAALASFLIPGGWPRACWACSPSALGDVLKITNYQPNEPQFEAGVLGAQGTLMGRPLFVTDVVPSLGSPGDLTFFDPGCYVIGDRQQVTIDASPHPLFQTQQTVLRVWVRCAGMPLLDTVVTLSNGDTAAGCVIIPT